MALVLIVGLPLEFPRARLIAWVNYAQTELNPMSAQTKLITGSIFLLSIPLPDLTSDLHEINSRW